MHGRLTSGIWPDLTPDDLNSIDRGSIQTRREADDVIQNCEELQKNIAGETVKQLQHVVCFFNLFYRWINNCQTTVLPPKRIPEIYYSANINQHQFTNKHYCHILSIVIVCFARNYINSTSLKYYHHRLMKSIASIKFHINFLFFCRLLFMFH